ncbi:MAG: IS1595 family transposase [Nitrososphaerales archaeon]
METHVPQTLQQAVLYFADPNNCLEFIKMLRWPNGVTCPKCGCQRCTYIKSRQLFICRQCKKNFSLKVGTIFEKSQIPLDKWLLTMWLVCNCKNGISSWEVARDIGVTQKTAWFMCHRIRTAMHCGSFEKMTGTVEADETFIGGKARNMHKGKRKVRGSGVVGKSVVMGLLDRHGEVRVRHIKGTKKRQIEAQVKEHVEPGSELFTDSLASYTGLSKEYVHAFVNHAEKYVDGRVHTNGLENFWSLLKRGLKGTYVCVQPFHLFRYLDEEAFRFNKRDRGDQQRFIEGMAGTVGKRLTYRHLIDRDEVDPLESKRGPKRPNVKKDESLDDLVAEIIGSFPTPEEFERLSGPENGKVVADEI